MQVPLGLIEQRGLGISQLVAVHSASAVVAGEVRVGALRLHRYRRQALHVAAAVLAAQVLTVKTGDLLLHHHVNQVNHAQGPVPDSAPTGRVALLGHAAHNRFAVNHRWRRSAAIRKLHLADLGNYARVIHLQPMQHAIASHRQDAPLAIRHQRGPHRAHAHIGAIPHLQAADQASRLRVKHAHHARVVADDQPRAHTQGPRPVVSRLGILICPGHFARLKVHAHQHAEACRAVVLRRSGIHGSVRHRQGGYGVVVSNGVRGPQRGQSISGKRLQPAVVQGDHHHAVGIHWAAGLVNLLRQLGGLDALAQLARVGVKHVELVPAGDVDPVGNHDGLRDVLAPGGPGVILQGHLPEQLPILGGGGQVLGAGAGGVSGPGAVLGLGDGGGVVGIGAGSTAAGAFAGAGLHRLARAVDPQQLDGIALDNLLGVRAVIGIGAVEHQRPVIPGLLTAGR